MEFRQLELFLAVIESGSVTRAAARVALSPGAVSMQLHQLATELRTELFVRSGRRFLPTPAATRLADHARSLLRQVREVEQEFEADPARDTRPFLFATGATALIYCLAKPLRQVRAAFPEARIQVTVSATEAIVAGLLDRRFDMGLISLPFPPDGLQIVPLFEEELLVLRPSRTPVSSSRTGTLQVKDLEKASFILYPPSSNMRTIIDRFFRECGLAPQVLMEAEDTEALKGLVEAGFGYSILPQRALRAQARHFETFRVAGHRLARVQALATPQTAYPRALTSALVSLLRRSLAVQ